MTSLRRHLTDLLAVAGLTAILVGVRHWSPAAAWVVGGIALLVYAVLLARRESSS